jgi:hypothetical protein
VPFRPRLPVNELHDPKAGTSSPTAGEVLRRIAELFLIERDVGGLSAEHRCAVRQRRAKPIIEAF